MTTKFKRCKLIDFNGNLKKQWYIYYTYYNIESGKNEIFKIYISQKLKTKTDRYSRAKEIIKQQNKLLESGFNPYCQTEDKTQTNVVDALALILKIREHRTTKKKTRQAENYIANKFIDFLKETKKNNKKISGITKQDIQEYQDYLIAECGLCPRSCNNSLDMMRTLFNALKEREYITDNVFTKVKRLQVPESTIVQISGISLKKIKTHLPNYDYKLYCFICFIYYGFMRPVEITRLRRRNLDFERKLIYCDASLSKNKKQQTIRMPDKLYELLIKYKYDEIKDEKYIFSNRMSPGKNYISTSGVQKKWKKFREDNDLGDTQMYWLKHTSNGLAIDSGISVTDVQLQNRHHSLDQTMQYLNRFRKISSDKINEIKGL